MPPSPLARLRKLCLALPEVHEVEAWGEPTFRIRNKMFATYASATSHHGEGRPAAWLKAEAGTRDLLIRMQQQRYFVPPYVGVNGWIGAWLDRNPDWPALGELVRDAYLLTAPKRSAARVR